MVVAVGGYLDVAVIVDFARLEGVELRDGRIVFRTVVAFADALHRVDEILPAEINVQMGAFLDASGIDLLVEEPLLNQHEKAAEMVQMRVGDENGIKVGEEETVFRKLSADGVACVDQIVLAADLKQRGGMESRRRDGAVGGSEEDEFRVGLFMGFISFLFSRLGILRLEFPPDAEHGGEEAHFLEEITSFHCRSLIGFVCIERETTEYTEYTDFSWSGQAAAKNND